MSNSDEKVNWGRWLTEHLAGTIILGSTFAGVGAVKALRAGTALKPEMTAYAALGTLSGLGFGRMVYTGLFGKTHSTDIASTTKPSKEPVTWTDRVKQDRSLQPKQER